MLPYERDARTTLKVVPLSPFLPRRLTICVWGHAWYMRARSGEPFEDLEAAFQRMVELGYNTVRICALPFLLFRSRLGTLPVTFEAVDADVAGSSATEVRLSSLRIEQDRLLEVFRLAKRYNCFVIASSWEYRRDPSLGMDRAWLGELIGVEADERATVLGEAWKDLVDLLDRNQLTDRLAFLELHSDVEAGYLTDDLPGDRPPVIELEERLDLGMEVFRSRHLGVSMTVAYAHVPVGQMRGVPENADVAVFSPVVDDPAAPDAVAKLRTSMEIAADFALMRDIPLIFAGGWRVPDQPGRQPADDAAYARLCEQAVQIAAEVGARGTVVSSEAAPHYPLWHDAELQKRCNDHFRTANTAPTWCA